MVSLLTFHLYHQGIQAVLSQIQEQQLSYADHLSSQIRFFFQARSRGLRAISSLPSIRGTQPENQKRDIEAYSREISKVYVRAVTLYDIHGKAIYSTDPGITGITTADSKLLQWAREKENVGRITLAPAAKGRELLMFTLAVPIYRKSHTSGHPLSQGQFSGLLSFTLDMKAFLADQLESKGLLISLDQIWIVDRDGTLIFLPDHPDMVFRNIHQKEVNCRSCHGSFNHVKEILSRKQGIVDYEVRGFSKKIAAFVPMEFEGASWVIVANVPYERVTGFLRRSLRDHLFLLVIVLAALTVGSALLLRKERMKIKAEEEVLRWQEKTAERRKAEEALELERNNLKDILDSIEDGIYIVDQQYEVLYANPAIVRRFGSVRKRKCYEYIHDLPRICDWCKFEEVLTGKTVSWEWHSAKTGRTYDFLDTPFAASDGIRCKLCVVREVTDRKKVETQLRQSEERYRMLVETMSDGLGVQDEKGVWVYVNDRLCEMLDYAKEDMVGRRVTDFLSEHDQIIYRRQMAARMQGEGGFYELTWLRKDGQPMYTLVSPKAILDERGEFKGSFAILTGITERKRAEEALKESEKQLRELSTQLLTAQETERKRISTELHDELGQALTVLKLHLNFIERNLSAQQTGLRHECEKAIEYIEQVIENVRRLSRDLSPTILEDFGLSAAIRWLVGNFAKRHNIRVALDMIDIDALVSRDSHTILYRIIQEALTNIGKHSEAKNVTMTVQRDMDTVSFAIKDDGKGFDAAETVARGPEEKGLGLVTMMGRAQMLGGAMSVQAEAGKGTRVTLTVPVKGGNQSKDRTK